MKVENELVCKPNNLKIWSQRFFSETLRIAHVTE
jgi:hypothetical protein